MLSFTKQERLVLKVILTVIVFGGVAGLIFSKMPAVDQALSFLDRPVTRAAIDLNTSDREKLLSVPGIGPALAQRILTQRELKGGFRSLEELRTIPGIGPKTFLRITPYLRIRP